jgi:hypothetical protein
MKTMPCSTDRFLVALPLLGQDVRVDADDVRVVGEAGAGDEEALHGAHERGLARAAVADEEHVRRGMPDQVLDHGDRDLPDRVILADDVLAQLLEDVPGAEGEGHAGREYKRELLVAGCWSGEPVRMCRTQRGWLLVVSCWLFVRCA